MASGPDVQGLAQDVKGVGDHVHHLLALAQALSQAAESLATSSGPGTSVVPLGVELGVLDDAELVSWACTLEHLSHFLEALQVQGAGELATRVRAGRYAATGVKEPVGMLLRSLRLGKAEAYRRLGLAERFLPTTDAFTGEVLAPTQPVLGTVFLGGGCSLENASVATRFLDEATHLVQAGRIAATERAELETTLASFVGAEAPDMVRRIGTHALALLDPDGNQPTEGALLAKQGMFFHQPRRGLIHFEGHMTTLQYEHLMAALGHATNPRPHNTRTDAPVNESASTSNNDAVPDLGLLAELLSPPAKPPETPPSQAPDTPPAPPGAVDDAWSRLEAEPFTAQGWNTPTLDPKDFTATATASVTVTVQDGSPGTGGGVDEAGVGVWPRFVDGVSVPAPGFGGLPSGMVLIDPDSTDPVTKDQRTHGQKLLDGLIDAVKLAARTDKLPNNGGLRPQLLITLTGESLDARAGVVHTPYSGPSPLGIFAEALCDVDTTTITYPAEPPPTTQTGTRTGSGVGGSAGRGTDRSILNAGRTRRLFSTEQRKILLARDLGCSFPDCMAPAFWTEAHHIIPWLQGGETNINNGCLLCGHHHHLIHHSDWTVKLTNGTPEFTPPYKLDPTKTPRHNNYHHANPHNG